MIHLLERVFQRRVRRLILTFPAPRQGFLPDWSELYRPHLSVVVYRSLKECQWRPGYLLILVPILWKPPQPVHFPPPWYPLEERRTVKAQSKSGRFQILPRPDPASRRVKPFEYPFGRKSIRQGVAILPPV